MVWGGIRQQETAIQCKVCEGIHSSADLIFIGIFGLIQYDSQKVIITNIIVYVSCSV